MPCPFVPAWRRGALFAWLALLLQTSGASAGVELLDSGRVRVDWQDTPLVTALHELGELLDFHILTETAPGPGQRLYLQQTAAPERLLARLLQRQNYLLRYDAAARIRELVLLGPAGRAPDVRLEAAPSAPRTLGAFDPRDHHIRPRAQSGALVPSARERLSWPAHELNLLRLPVRQSQAASMQVSEQVAEAGAGTGREAPEPPLHVSPEVRKTLTGLTRRARDQVLSLASQLEAVEAAAAQEER